MLTMEEALASRRMVDAFFNHVARNEREAALALVMKDAFPGGVDSPPSPRAAPYVGAGRWEEPDVPVPLRLITLDMCRGEIKGGDGQKVCCRNQQICSIKGHGTRKVVDRPKWLIGDGGKSSIAAYTKFYLPANQSDAPIHDSAARILCDPTNPFKMKPVFWEYVIQTYWEYTEVVSTPTSEFSAVLVSGKTDESTPVVKEEEGVQEGALLTVHHHDDSSSDPKAFTFTEDHAKASERDDSEGGTGPEWEEIVSALEARKAGSWGKRIGKGIRKFQASGDPGSLKGAVLASVEFMDEFVPLKATVTTLTARLDKMEHTLSTFPPNLADEIAGLTRFQREAEGNFASFEATLERLVTGQTEMSSH